jgi:hypothetical protein
MHPLEVTHSRQSDKAVSTHIVKAMTGLFRLRNVITVFFFAVYYYLNFYIFRSYDHLQVEIHLLGFTRLTTDPLFSEYS